MSEDYSRSQLEDQFAKKLAHHRNLLLAKNCLLKLSELASHLVDIEANNDEQLSKIHQKEFESILKSRENQLNKCVNNESALFEFIENIQQSNSLLKNTLALKEQIINRNDSTSKASPEPIDIEDSRIEFAYSNFNPTLNDVYKSGLNLSLEILKGSICEENTNHLSYISKLFHNAKEISKDPYKIENVSNLINNSNQFNDNVSSFKSWSFFKKSLTLLSGISLVLVGAKYAHVHSLEAVTAIESGLLLIKKALSKSHEKTIKDHMEGMKENLDKFVAIVNKMNSKDNKSSDTISPEPPIFETPRPSLKKRISKKNEE